MFKSMLSITSFTVTTRFKPMCFVSVGQQHEQTAQVNLHCKSTSDMKPFTGRGSSNQGTHSDLNYFSKLIVVICFLFIAEENKTTLYALLCKLRLKHTV